jgi:predicted nucleic acid-binding protein
MSRYLLDTNIISDLVRHPAGRAASHVSRIGEETVCTSIVVAAELRYGAAKKESRRLSTQLEAILEHLMSFHWNNLSIASMQRCASTWRNEELSSEPTIS